jgi:hypothetical protein
MTTRFSFKFSSDTSVTRVNELTQKYGLTIQRPPVDHPSGEPEPEPEPAQEATPLIPSDSYIITGSTRDLVLLTMEPAVTWFKTELDKPPHQPPPGFRSWRNESATK